MSSNENQKPSGQISPHLAWPKPQRLLSPRCPMPQGPVPLKIVANIGSAATREQVLERVKVEVAAKWSEQRHHRDGPLWGNEAAYQEKERELAMNGRVQQLEAKMAESEAKMAESEAMIATLVEEMAQLKRGLGGVIQSQRDVRLRCLATYRKQTSSDRSQEQRELDDQIISQGHGTVHDGNIALDAHYLQKEEDRETFLKLYGISDNIFRESGPWFEELRPIFDGRATIKLRIADLTFKGLASQVMNVELEGVFQEIRKIVRELRKQGKDINLVLADPKTPLGDAKTRFENLLNEEKRKLKIVG